MPDSTDFPHPPAPLWPRFGSIVYETMLLFGVCFIFSYLYLALSQQTYPLPAGQRHVFQGYLFLVLGGYFVWFWCRSGQTLAMKTWQIRLVTQAGQPLPIRIAALRYCLAWLSLSAGLLGFLWALIDRDRQFLHDRILGTRLISVRPSPPSTQQAP